MPIQSRHPTRRSSRPLRARSFAFEVVLCSALAATERQAVGPRFSTRDCCVSSSVIAWCIATFANKYSDKCMNDNQPTTIAALLQTAASRDVIPIVVHELRMPLVSMRAATALIQQHCPECQTHFDLSPLLQSLQALQTEVNNLLQLREIGGMFDESSLLSDNVDEASNTIDATLTAIFANLQQQTGAVHQIVPSVLAAWNQHLEPQLQQVLAIVPRQLEAWDELLDQDLQQALSERLKRMLTT